MKAKFIIPFLTALLSFKTLPAQAQEVTDSLTRELQEVIVMAKQPSTKLVGTSLVTTVAGTNLTHLGNALDVLAQLPLIMVEDNAVNIIGKNKIEIYIDGHPMLDEQELEHIPSSNIKKVELLMAPGAAYESTTGAVLKITTKRVYLQGLSLTDQFKLQRRRRWSVMDYLGVNYRTGNWELFVDGTINRDNSLSKGTTTNTLLYEGRETTVGGSQNNSYPTTAGVIKGGLNYSKDAQCFGAYYRYNPELGDFTNTGTEWFDKNPVLRRQIDKRISSHSHLASVYYENIIADKYLIHFDGDYRGASADNRTFTQYSNSALSNVNSTDKRKSTLWAGKLYVKLPLWRGDFTVGLQDSYTHTSLDFKMLNSQVSEYIPSSLTEAVQTSAAMFVSWSHISSNFSISAGARYEYVNFEFKVDGKCDENESKQYHLLTPDISLGYTFNEASQLSLSYKMATVKPPYSQLTGSLNYVGLHEIEGGNPTLRDEKMHDIQLFGIWKNLILQADYLRSFDSYAYVKQVYPAEDLQLLMHPININVSALSLYLSWSQPTGLWTPNLTTGFYRQWLTLDNTQYNKPIFSYYFDNTISLPHDWIITANITGRTQGDMHTNRFGTTWLTMNASIGKTLLNKTLTMKVSATDIFNTQNNNWTMNTYGICVNKQQNYDQRGISLNITYTFQPYKSKYKGSSAAEAELKRL